MKQAFVYTDKITGKDIYYTKDSMFAIFTRIHNCKKSEIARFTPDKIQECLDKFYSLQQHNKDRKYLVHFDNLNSLLIGSEGTIIYKQKGTLERRPLLELRTRLHVPRKKGVKTIIPFQIIISSYPIQLIEKFKKLDKLLFGVPLSRFNVYLLKYLLAEFLSCNTEEQKKRIATGKIVYFKAREVEPNEEDELV